MRNFDGVIIPGDFGWLGGEGAEIENAARMVLIRESWSIKGASCSSKSGDALTVLGWLDASGANDRHHVFDLYADILVGFDSDFLANTVM